MANIEEYLPQVSTPEPVGGVSPNIELAGVMGRAVSHLGEDISQVGQTIRNRSAQQETADVYADFANQRQYWTSRVQQETQNGSLDVDKISQDYDDQTSDLSQNLSTPQGKNYFERQQARLKGQVLHMATSGAATVASNESAGSWQKAIDTNSAVVQQDPSQLQDLVHQGMETVDSLIQAGGMPEKMRDKAVSQMQSQYTESAIIGQAQNGTKEGPSIAAAMLKDPAFAGALNVQQREMLDGRIKAAARDFDTQQATTRRITREAQQDTDQAFLTDNYADIYKGKIGINDIVNAKGISFEAKQRAIQIQREANNVDKAPNVRLEDNLYQQINSGQIKNVADIIKHVSPNGLTVEQGEKLVKNWSQTKDQQDIRSGENGLFKVIDRLKFDDMTGQQDIAGVRNAVKAKQDYLSAKDKILKSGGNLNDILNPNSPNYFGSEKNMGNYQNTWQQQLDAHNKDRIGKANGTQPTGNNPNPTPNKRAITPEMTPADMEKVLKDQGF